MPGSKLVPPGWYSRRHETPEAHHTSRDRYGTYSERQRRRRASALIRRESQLAWYLSGVFCKGVRASDEGRVIEQAQTEINSLRDKLGIAA